jgi:hypothetical protein
VPQLPWLLAVHLLLRLLLLLRLPSLQLLLLD